MNDLEDLIDHMKHCGWYKDDSGRIRHAEACSESYENWLDAIAACIEVASGA